MTSASTNPLALIAELTHRCPLHCVYCSNILELVRAARDAGLYVNLITSGMPLDEARLAKLIDAGLDHLQLSVQAATEKIAAEISGTKSHPQTLLVVEWLKRVRVAVTLN